MTINTSDDRLVLVSGSFLNHLGARLTAVGSSNGRCAILIIFVIVVVVGLSSWSCALVAGSRLGLCNTLVDDARDFPFSELSEVRVT